MRVGPEESVRRLEQLECGHQGAITPCQSYYSAVSTDQTNRQCGNDTNAISIATASDDDSDEGLTLKWQSLEGKALVQEEASGHLHKDLQRIDQTIEEMVQAEEERMAKAKDELTDVRIRSPRIACFSSSRMSKSSESLLLPEVDLRVRSFGSQAAVRSCVSCTHLTGMET